MDNHFFRQCFPHRVECTEKTIRVYSQQPNLLIFEGIMPKDFDKDKFFNSLAADRPDYIGSTICYLYNVNENPVGNIKAYDKEWMNVYKRRLDVLIDYMRGIEPIFVVPQPPQN